MLVCADDFPLSIVDLMAAPIAARAAQVAKAEKADRKHMTLISDGVSKRERNFLKQSPQFKIRLFIMSTCDKSPSVRGSDLEIVFQKKEKNILFRSANLYFNIYSVHI